MLGAAKRPLNSALELDLDFERQVRPPPQPTEEATASLEDLIKQRIADQLFDDPPRILPPQPEKQKVELELEDKKSHKAGHSPSHNIPDSNPIKGQWLFKPSPALA